MKRICIYIIALITCFSTSAQTSPNESEINFQDIYLFKNVKTQKMLEVEDGLFSKGSKVQQYFPYARNGVTDGYNQQWIIIPAGKRAGRPVYYIINYGFLKYLDSVTPITVQEGNDADNQLWILEKLGQNWLIKSYLSEQYLELPNGVSNDGAPFSIAPYTGEANQQFTMIRYVGRTGPGNSFIDQKLNISPAYADNKVIDATGATNDVQLVINDPVSSNIRQQWKFSINNGYYEIRPIVAATRCAAVAGLSMDNAARVVSWDCVNNPNERWIIIPVIREKGKFILFNCNSGKCLNVSGGNSTQNGASITQYIYSNLENCKWKIKMAR